MRNYFYNFKRWKAFLIKTLYSFKILCTDMERTPRCTVNLKKKAQSNIYNSLPSVYKKRKTRHVYYLHLFGSMCAKSVSHVRLFATQWTITLLCPWNFPGKNTGVGCHFLFQGLFPTQRLKLHLLHCQVYFLSLYHPGSPFISIHKNKLWKNT